ncbi:MAG: hypothetical protein PHG44_07290 [Lentisphaeria bacterium]|nr:hypothetical protein [Lentisphaeria bacterium]MDY0177313.1 hypothetical protein [Lentisphaeria bacterium]NLZ60594.1 hypothetical protein [Lentisphaerota bacterium]
MASELVYTSAERGLRPGTRGYCTVAHTRGLSPARLQILEALSAYKSLFALHDEQEADNPVSYSHHSSRLLGSSMSVLSRVSPSQADHTGRSNKLAHHVLLSSREYPPAGPLWLSQQEGFFFSSWQEEPRIFEQPKLIPQGSCTVLEKAQAWEELSGDAGHASLLPAAFLANPAQPVYVIYTIDMPVLQLLSESLALLPPQKRWQVTYNSYFNRLPVGMSCMWRCCVANSEVLRELNKNSQCRIVDLSAKLPPPGEGELCRLAREGGSMENKKKDEAAGEGQGRSAKRRDFVLMPQRKINMLSLKPRSKEDDL